VRSRELRLNFFERQERRRSIGISTNGSPAIAVASARPHRSGTEFLGLETDSEKVIRWLIALMVLCCTPSRLPYRFGTAIDHRLKPRLVRSSCDRCRGDAIRGHSG